MSKSHNIALNRIEGIIQSVSTLKVLNVIDKIYLTYILNIFKRPICTWSASMKIYTYTSIIV